MKDQSKLFNRVPEAVYEVAYKRLLALRKEYPAYRDDQLLMFELCNTLSGMDKIVNWRKEVRNLSHELRHTTEVKRPADAPPDIRSK